MLLLRHEYVQTLERGLHCVSEDCIIIIIWIAIFVIPCYALVKC